MKQYIIHPYEGFDEIRFGMSRTEIHNILESPKRSSKNRLGEIIEIYEKISLIYSKIDLLVEVTFSTGCSVQYENYDLLNDYNGFKKLLNDETALESVGYFVFPQKGIALIDFLPLGNDDRVVGIFARERWENFQKGFKPVDKETLLNML